MDLSALLTLIMSVLQSVPIGESAQNALKGQQQAMQRQLSASDLANNPNKFMARINSMLGLGGNPNAPAGSAGNPGMLQQIQKLIGTLTPQLSSGLNTATMQQVSPELAAAGLTQAPGIANEELSTAIAPQEIQEQQIGAQLATGEQQGATNTANQTLQYPFQIGSGIAGQFPLAGAFV